jgi:AraC-like DNA-binding protein
MKPIFPRYHIGHFLNRPHHPLSFAITRFETMEEPEVEEVHQHSFYEIIWVEAGTSIQVIDYQSYPIAPGSLFFISPGQVHHFEEWHQLKGGSLFFLADFFPFHTQESPALFDFFFLDNRYSTPHFCPPKADWDAILHLFHLIEAENAHFHPNQRIQQGYLQALLAMIERSWRQNQPATPPIKALVYFKKFKNLLDQTLHEGQTAQYFAEKLHISTHHLNSICQQIAGCSTSQVIRDRIILEAQRLLTFTDLSSTEIAHHLSLTDSSWFAKIFRLSTGLSPSQFRKETGSTYLRLKN